MGIRERQERDREAIRRAILDAARELFVCEGYQNVSIRKIADRIEYSPAAIYGYFHSKDDIFFALAEEGFRLLSAGCEAPLGERELPPLARVRAAFWRLHEFGRQHPQYFALMFVDRHVPRISREYERFAFAREMKRQLQAQLQDCVDAGVFPPTVQPAVAFRLLVSGLLGIAVARLSDRLAPDENPDDLAADALDVTLAGLRAGVPLRSTARGDWRPLDDHPDPLSRSPKESVMRSVTVPLLLALLLGGALGTTACNRATGKAAERKPAAAPPQVDATPAVERPIARYVRATGTLTAEDEAAVAAETAGRIIQTPVERGTPVAAGGVLVRLSPAETEAQLAEADANAGQMEARLGLTAGAAFDVNKVPEVQNAKAGFDLAQSEFTRIQSLLDQRVVSQSEFDQRRTQLEAARQQYESAKNGASQLFQSLRAAQARVTLARKALADTTVRAPFDGLVAERFVSVGDYVTKGTKVATLVRINPLRVQLTVPEQFVSAVAVGQPVTFTVDAYPGRTFEGIIRYVAPALETNRRALTVEAVVKNPSHDLKPGLFATARIEQPAIATAVLAPAAAVRSSGGTSRLFVVVGDRVEERIVTTGQTVDTNVEIANGVKAGERVVTTTTVPLVDGARVTVAPPR